MFFILDSHLGTEPDPPRRFIRPFRDSNKTPKTEQHQHRRRRETRNGSPNPRMGSVEKKAKT